MSEVLEYRIQYAKYRIEMLVSLTLVCLSGVFAYIGTAHALYLVIGLGVYGFGLLVASSARAQYVDGYNRRFWEYLGDSREDPPLKSWYHDLEERNAFMGGEKA